MRQPIRNFARRWRGSKEILQWKQIFEAAAEREAGDPPDMEKDQIVIKSLMKRMREVQDDNNAGRTERED